MTVKVVLSQKPSPLECALELKAKLEGFNPSFVLFFATPSHAPTELAAALRAEFGEVPSLGCTTAGEIATGRVLDRSVVLMAFGADVIARAHVSHMAVSQRAADVEQAVIRLERSSGEAVASLDPQRYVGLVLHDGLSFSEERVMAHLGGLTNVPFVGGSAADGSRFERTTVFENFRPHTGATVLALLETGKPYSILKTQSFSVRPNRFVATEVDEARRVIKRLDGKPAAQQYAAALGVSPSEAGPLLKRHPVGVLVDGFEPFVRGVARLEGDDVVLFCQVERGSTLHLLEAGNIAQRTRTDLERAIERLGGAQAIVDFDCTERMSEIQRIGQKEAYGQVFRDVPTIGFSTYGESYIGHMNQTSTMLLLGK